MANKIQVKRSAVPSKVPTTSDIDLGEIAINTYDGKMYIKKDDGTAAVVEIGAGGSGTVTSVDVSGGTTGLTTSGGPVTTSGTITLAGTLAIANGGTGQTTATAAFDALAPTTTKGDIVVFDGTDNIRLAVGTNDYVLTADSTTASGLAWKAASGGGGGGATGGGTDEVFYENDQAVTTDYTISTNKNAMSAGPITINSGVTVTVPSGSTWVIV